MTHDALGMIETKGMGKALEAANIMVKTSDIELIGKESAGASQVTVMIRGELGAVKRAIDAAASAIKNTGHLISFCVIPRPHPMLQSILPKR